MTVYINGGYRFQRAPVGSNRGPDGVCENDFVHCVSPPASQNREIGGCGALPDTRPSRHDGLGKCVSSRSRPARSKCAPRTRRKATRRSSTLGGHFSHDSGHWSPGWPNLVAGRSTTQNRQIRAPTVAARKPSIYARTDACFATADASKLVACAVAVAKSDV
jgi:hypothetical protein